LVISEHRKLLRIGT